MTSVARILLILGLLGSSPAYGSPSTFRFHLPSEPMSLAPARLGSADVSMLFHNLYRGLYSYSSAEGLKPEGAKSCVWQKRNLELTCRLSKKSVWSDGKPVTALEYVTAWRALFAPEAKATSSALLLNLKNARAILHGEKKKEDLGVSAPSADTLKIEFEKPDPEFLHKLSLVTLVPIRSEKFPDRKNASSLITNGPYKISKWRIGSRLTLEPNKLFHPKSAASRPPVEILFIEEDLTALNLYEIGELTFLRRLPTQHFEKYASRPDFENIDVARFDYVGFGSLLANRPHLRKALTLSANYSELQKIYQSPGMPGCPSLSPGLMTKIPCLKFNLAEAKKAIELSRKTENLPARIELAYSKLGGDSIRQGMEWFHSQWTKNLGLTIDLTPMEQGVYLAKLKSKPPAIFRKGVGLDRPTCLAAVETFSSGGAENFLKFNDPKYEALINQLVSASSTSAKKALCTKALAYLLDQHRLIPLGRYTLSALASPKFTGWTLNEMQQLDLTRLKLSP